MEQTVRLNITLPRNVLTELDKLTPAGKRSRFIAEAVTEKIRQQKDKELSALLEEGYKANRELSLEMANDFAPADLEGWQRQPAQRHPDSFRHAVK